VRRIVVVGDLVLDVVVALQEPPAPDSDAEASTRLRLGGAGANVAAWVAAAGGRAALVGRVGDDTAGRDHRAALEARGIASHVTVDAAAPTGTIVVLTAPDGSRTMLTDRGANLRLRPDDLPTPIGRPGDHLHLSGYVLLREESRAAGLAALRAARAAGLTTSVDASSAAPLRHVGPGAFLGWVEGVDVLRANREEALVLAPEADDAAGAARALAGGGAAVVTDGAAGAVVAAAGGCTAVPAVAPGLLADTVGAGDALTAGLLVALVGGAGMEAACAAGTALAARALAVTGGQPP
jgi:ribokinase